MPFDPRKDPEYLQAMEEFHAAGAQDKEKKFAEFSDSEIKKTRPFSNWMDNLPSNITVGVIDAVLNMEDFAGEAASAAVGDSPEGAAMKTIFQASGFDEARKDARGALTTFRDFLSRDSNIGDKLTQAVAQFLVPFTGWAKAIGGLKGASLVGTVGRVATAESATAATVLDPHEGRLADLFEYGKTLEGKLGNTFRTIAPDGSLANAYIDYMTEREGETVAEGRFKNVVDNLVAAAAVGGPLTTAVVSYRGLRLAFEKEVAAMKQFTPAQLKAKE